MDGHAVSVAWAGGKNGTYVPILSRFNSPVSRSRQSLPGLEFSLYPLSEEAILDNVFVVSFR